MRRVILYMITTLDGLIAGPDDALAHYEPSDEEHRFANDLFGRAGAVLFGRVAYEGFVSYWDTLDLTDASTPRVAVDFATIFRSKPRVVFSRTLEEVDGDAVLVKDDIAGAVSKLKRQPGGDLLLVCGPELLSTFVAAGLIDEFQVLVAPTVLGEGKALFAGVVDQLQLELLETRVFGSGSVLLRYRPARAAA
jgi:dihydrofolate reductase